MLHDPITQNQQYTGYQPTQAQQVIEPAIPSVYRLGKNGKQIIIVTDHIYTLFHQNHLALCINELGTHYVVHAGQFIPVESQAFFEFVQREAHSLRLLEFPSHAITKVIAIIKLNRNMFIRYDESITNGSVRIVHHHDKSYYNYAPNHYIHLNLQHSQLLAPVAFLGPHTFYSTTIPDVNNLRNINYIRSLENNFQPVKLQAALQFLLCNDKQILLVMSWMVQCFVNNDFVALQIIDPKMKQGKNIIELIKNIIDPSSEKLVPLPAKKNDIISSGTNHYVIPFTTDRKALTPIQESSLLELLIDRGSKHNLLSSCKKEGYLFVKRPIILLASRNVIQSELLMKNTLTIEISPSSYAINSPTTLNQNINIDASRYELLCMAIYFNTFRVYETSQCQNPIESFEPSYLFFMQVGNFCERMMKLEKGTFIKVFEHYMERQLFEAIKDEVYLDISDLLIAWAKENLNTKKTQSISDWKITLSVVASELDINIDHCTPRKIGAAFKDLQPYLNQLGIDLEPVSGCTRYRDWTVLTQDKIGISLSAKPPHEPESTL